ncbi:MAG: hypothetical protein CVT62_08290 [Actinobacteria bacterium HGW-Actinobacteria-2]|nr:MAG: hypothetical protein CVT62_08290 [Actinobacteria bacterium HGW-Actinobacteria-2]
MSTQWSNPESEQQWQQPSFSGPTYTGEVLSPGQRPTSVVAPGAEEVRLRMLRRWLFPLALVFAVISGAWWQAIVLVVLVSWVLRHRIRQLRYQRLVASGVIGGVGPRSASDLR